MVAVSIIVFSHLFSMFQKHVLFRHVLYSTRGSTAGAGLFDRVVRMADNHGAFGVGVLSALQCFKVYFSRNLVPFLEVHYFMCINEIVKPF